MIGKALDPITNDLYLSGSRIAMVSELDQTVQSIKTRLLFFTAEWFLDLTAGTPYFQEIFVKPVNLDNVSSIIKKRILQTPNVTELISFDLSFTSSDRSAIITFEANTVYGATEEQEVSV